MYKLCNSGFLRLFRTVTLVGNREGGVQSGPLAGSGIHRCSSRTGFNGEREGRATYDSQDFGSSVSSRKTNTEFLFSLL